MAVRSGAGSAPLLAAFRRKARPLRTGKCTVAFGTWNGRHAVLKRLRVRDRFWVDHFRKEIGWYERFERLGSPGPTPQLLAADKRRCLLVTTRAEGLPLSEQRYVSKPLDAAHVRALLRTMHRLHGWRPYPVASANTVRQSYITRFHKYVDAGSLMLDAPLRAKVVRCVQETDWQPEFNHGDLLLSNVLVACGRVTLIDWEFAGWFLPGYDCALLWLLLASDPAARRQVEQDIGARPQRYQHGFQLNRLLLIGRETRIHEALPSGEKRTKVLAQLSDDLKRAVQEWAT